ncbi:MAG: 50S ribosomal protein L31 [Phototrophicaceae bacterium]
MKKDLHPKWYSDAVVTCACGNTWQTGAAVKTISTDICSACHPFYTGEQRIVDTEGRVDKFMNRLRSRDNIVAKAQERESARTPMNLPITEAGFKKATIDVLVQNDINTVGDFLARFSEIGDEGFLELKGIGRQALAEIKKSLRVAGYELPSGQDE